VSFAEHASAVKALEGMANKVLEEGQEPLYVNRAEKKTERSRNIKNKLDALLLLRSSPLLLFQSCRFNLRLST